MARRFFASAAAAIVVVGMLSGIGVTAAGADPGSLAISTTSPLPLAPLSVLYSTTLEATGGTGSYTWSVAQGSSLPGWLSLNSSTGVLSGTPITDATYTFAVTVTDSASPAATATSGQLTLYAGNGGTEPFALNMTSGSWSVVSTGSPPQSFPPQTTTTLTGTVAPLTGAITDATLTLPVQDNVCNGSGCTNYLMDEVAPGTATGSINSNGDITLNDSLSYELDVISPITAECLSTPINMIFQSTAPYNTSSGEVTLTALGYTIPDFTGTDGNPDSDTNSCGLAQDSLNSGVPPDGVAGSTNNNTTLNLTGTGLPLPPPPGKSTTNTLTASPDSPQLAGTSVTLTDTVSSGGDPATDATGDVNFVANGTSIAIEPVINGTATLTTTNLLITTNQLTAVYSGDLNYAGSTSDPVSYTIQPVPTVSANLPAAVVTGAATPTAFSVTVANPSTSQSWNNLYLTFVLDNIIDPTLTLSYQDSAGNWCPLLNGQQLTGSDGGSTVTTYYSGSGTPPCGTSPAGFSLAPGASLTIPFEISFPAGANAGLEYVAATLNTGACTSSTSCTAVAPLSGTTPSTMGWIAVTPSTRYPVTILALSASSTVPEGYLYQPEPDIYGPDPSGNIYYPSPEDLTTILIDNTVVATGDADSYAITSPSLSTAGLSPGTHTLTIDYSGGSFYQPATYSTIFTVVPAAPGTPFVCTSASYSSIPASIVAVGNVPSSASSGSTVPVSSLDLTFNINPGFIKTTRPLTNITIGSIPGGNTITPASVTPTSANGIESVSWTGLSTTVPISGTVGSVVPVGISSIDFTSGSTQYTCSPASPDTPAVVGQVVVSGTVLTTSPTTSAAVGAAVELTASVFPTPEYPNGGSLGPNSYGQVEFLDNGAVLGTAVVDSTGDAARGTASLTTNVMPLGSNALTAQWSGTVSIPANTSAPVDFQVGTVPTVTTQPTDQTVNAGATAAFTVAASGTPTPTVQWQLSTDGGSTWNDIDGATSDSYTTPVTAGADNHNQYQAVFTNGFGSVSSNPATLTVDTSPVVTTGPTSQTVTSGSSVSFTAAASGNPTPTVQWQVSTNGGSSFTNIAGAMSATLTFAAADADNDNQYQAVFTNSVSSATSDTATLTVNDVPQVTIQPTNQSASAGQAVTFTAAGSGKPAPTIQWQVSTDGGGTFTNISGATSDSLTLSPSTTANNNQYRAVFTNSAGVATSDAATLTVIATDGYRLVGSDGAVLSFGSAGYYGSMGGQPLNAPIVGIASTPDNAGYWLVASDGGIFAFGDAAFYGSMGGQPLNKPIVGIATTPDGKGYWLVASDGGIFAFGDAAFYGSTGSMVLNKPVVGIAATPDGRGYWLVASDGGIFAFGDAQFYGSMGGQSLNAPITGIAAAPNGAGYWEVASDGGVFTFGSAGFHGAAHAPTASIVAITPTSDGNGYWEAGADGSVYALGDAQLSGTAAGMALGGPIVGLAT